MQKIFQRLSFGPVAQFFTDEVLDGFNIVIGGRFDLFNALGVVEREIVDDVIEHVLHDRCQRREFSNVGFIGKALQPAYLDQYAEANQTVFAEDIAKIMDLVGVTAVGR